MWADDSDGSVGPGSDDTDGPLASRLPVPRASLALCPFPASLSAVPASGCRRASLAGMLLGPSAGAIGISLPTKKPRTRTPRCLRLVTLPGLGRPQAPSRTRIRILLRRVGIPPRP